MMKRLLFILILLGLVLSVSADRRQQNSRRKATAAAGGTTPTIHWWKLNDASGTSINADAGPDGTTDGTLNNDHLALNGTSQEASTDSTITTTGIEIVTVTWWQQMSSWNHAGPNYSFNDGYGFNGGIVAFEQSGTFNFVVGHSGVYRHETASTANLPTGEYVNFACIYDNSTASGNITVYTNGVEMPLSILADNKMVSSDIYAGTVFWGAYDTTQGWTGGDFDDTRIYSGALSAGDIATIHTDGRQ